MVKSSSERYYLDTSIFIQVLSLDSKLKHFVTTKLTVSGRTMASYFTLIEINKYFIQLAIRMYDKIDELKDVPSAKVSLSNDFNRAPTYYMILDALVDRNIALSPSMPGYRMYLAHLETVIVTLQDELFSMVNEFKGVFAKHPIAQSRVYKSSDFPKHTAVLSANKEIDYSPAWLKYRHQLIQAEAYFRSLPKLKMLQKEISVLVTQVLTDPNGKRSKHFGDLVIGLDAPLGVHILAHDHSFPIIGESIGKKTTYITAIHTDI